MIRTLIVDDSQSFRHALDAVLSQDPTFSVVGHAANGLEALTLARKLQPNLVVMDLVMPGMNGFEATAALMRECPCPVVIVSSLVDVEAQQIVFEALSVGAVEVLKKPRDLASPQALEQMLGRLKAMADVQVTRRHGKIEHTAAPPRQAGPSGVVVVGASTGGPPALCEILRVIPGGYRFPIVVAQHLASGFAAGLRQWLQTTTALKIELVDEGMRMAPGHVYLAPDDRHIEVTWPFVRPALKRDEDPVSPSVDRLFTSVSGVGNVIAVLLTGMGEDGARALKKLRDGGAHTLVQDRGSSLVWGMPGVAIELEAATEQLSVSKIGPRLVALAAGEASP